MNNQVLEIWIIEFLMYLSAATHAAYNLPKYNYRITVYIYVYVQFITIIEICSFKYKSIKDNYAGLTGALPIDNLLSVLFSINVITRREKATIQEKSLREDKVSYLLDVIILPALEIGHDVKYNNLIEVMLSNEDSTAKRLANKLKQG